MTIANQQNRRKSVLVADDHLLLLDTLKLAIEAVEFKATTCQSGRDAIAKLKDSKSDFDLVLLDVHMPDMNGMSSIIEIVQTAYPTPVVLLTGGISDLFAHEAIQNGVRGYIPKHTNLRNLCDIIKVVINGGTCAPASVLAPKTEEDTVWGLSPREMSIGQLIANGLSNKLIAHELGLSETTVKMHIRSIFRKVGASNRAQVAAALQEHNLIHRDDPGAPRRMSRAGSRGHPLAKSAKRFPPLQ
ncbi:response regulator transcription factor [Phaeobacter sp.]|uniref:response regulator transcription factor n=1 Tax=Phaeobacter sp. TaxID=1902409 RepID=UPI0025EA8656|nr:response regulator transcription factor [Phaeobacter sp.]